MVFNLKYIFYLFLLFSLASCMGEDVYAKKAKTLDSLSGALNSMLAGIKKTDTIILQKALLRKTEYTKFILQNVNDTLSKSEADKVRDFMESGNILNSFAINRPTILARGSLINSQLEKLSSDIKTGSVSREQLQSLCDMESKEAGKLITTGYQQQSSFVSALEKFRNSISGVEHCIRSRNNGELPVIVKDPENF